MTAKRRKTSAKVSTGKAQLLTTSEASALVGYSQDHIGLLLRRSLVGGQKIGRDWLVNSKSLLKYVKKNPKPGPKPA